MANALTAAMVVGFSILGFMLPVTAFTSNKLKIHVQPPSGSLLRSSKSPDETAQMDFSTYIKPMFDDQIAQLQSCVTPRIIDMIPISTESSLQEDLPSPSISPSTNPKPLRQQLFTSPFISVLYERVLPPLWNAGLRIGGPQAEYEAAADFLLADKDNSDGRVLLDLSCGTGFVGQRFATNQDFRHVFALDYSPQMLTELVNSLQRQQSTTPTNISILRGDAMDLPFADGAIDAIHWGAAMHCVPKAEVALQEVYRVLKPGGKLYATTFLRPFPDVVFRFFTVPELQSMARQVGFGLPTPSSSSVLAVEGRGVYGIIKAVK